MHEPFPVGLAYVRVRIYSLDLSRSEEVELLVDTGSTYSWIPREVLSSLGIRPEAKRTFRTIEGRIVERSIGMGFIECLERRAPTVFVFAEKGDENVLGVHALEGLGLEVDPITRQLREAESILAV